MTKQNYFADTFPDVAQNSLMIPEFKLTAQYGVYSSTVAVWSSCHIRASLPDEICFESWNSFNSVQAWLLKLCIIWHFRIQPS